MLPKELRPDVNLQDAANGSVFSRLQLSGAGRAGAGILFPEFPLSVYCCFQSDIQGSTQHSESSIVSPCQDSSTYPKTLQAKFPTTVNPLRVVSTARWVLASLQLYLQGAGNASFSPCPLKTWGWESCQMRGGRTRQFRCCQPPVAVSPPGKVVI